MDRRQLLARAEATVTACNRRDPDAFVANVAEDVIWRDVALALPLHGRDALRAAAEAQMHAFPDMRVEATAVTIDPPRLVQEVTLTGTHRGALLGIEPTGRWTETHMATVLTFDEDGVIIEASVYWNLQGMLRQLGLAPDMATAAAA
jgi:steroid delta-isomerase-like uncharacterized protein